MAGLKVGSMVAQLAALSADKRAALKAASMVE
jgi:hypothetical protein